MEVQSVPEETVRQIVRESVDNCLKNEQYRHSEVSKWCSTIIETITRKLAELKLPFKFIVNCLICQKKGSSVNGMHITTGSVWDERQDRSLSHRMENKSMFCICNVFAISVQY
eukprot:TRINITY_DN1539_c0_g1_i1.p1 TRINITY_DN1539_c0_g1~~TRINITY_DN1539_c0_g1_i1.p1  ORF type:complete len:113 (-),score=29.45 TRINITY_DN1539_c0_g1_i1:211-549(-)